MNYRLLIACLVLGAGAVMADACGGDNGNGDGGPDVTVTDGGGGTDSQCFSNCGSDGGACSNLGVKCATNSECCTNNCVQGACQLGACTGDNQACTSNGQCCSQTCGSNGTCTPLPNNGGCTGKTLGNSCTTNSDCCSQFCSNGVCSAPSYCGQNGDLCLHNADCCGGLCVIQQGQNAGTCAQPPQSGAQCSAVDGTICSSSTNTTWDGGSLPACGGACCSRDCAPYGPTKVLICQPASGCHPVGDICAKDSDCCGGLPAPKAPSGVCNKASPSDPVGVCANPTGCKPNGDICRLQTNQCNATDNCCSGNVQQYDTCKQDNLGVPRCSYGGDAGCIPVGADAGCSTSADCCNLNPCVPNGNGGFTCYPQSCVPTSGVCTTDADCCPGGHCYIQGGQTSGTCQPTTTSDAGTDSGTDSGTCSAYGQLCTTSADCCNGIPCTAGRCIIPIN